MTWQVILAWSIAAVALITAILALSVALIARSSAVQLRERLNRMTALSDSRSHSIRAIAQGDNGEGADAGTETGTEVDAAESSAKASRTPAHAAVVLNPTKSGSEEIRELITSVSAMLGLPEPKFYETTVEDTGTGQARQAIEEGAQVVIAAGGDGTVRAVAEGLAHSGVPLGLVPMGTGNLLATNLGLNGTTDREQVNVALTGRNRPMDVGVLWTEALTQEELDQLHRASRDDTFGIDAPTDAVSTTFVVIGGMGFDAVMVGGVDENLKSRIGIFAYPIHALRHLFDHRLRARITMNTPEEGYGDVEVPTVEVTARSVMFANCGRLMSGVTLVPQAQIDDGWLDVVVMDTRGGIKGWVDLGNKVLLQGAGRRSNLSVLRDGKIESHKARNASLRTSQPHPVQVDGDIIALASTVHSRVEHDALLVRVAY